METISQVLFWVANSLLIPDILLLLLLFIRAKRCPLKTTRSPSATCATC